jgi:hypothetical protein
MKAGRLGPITIISVGLMGGLLPFGMAPEALAQTCNWNGPPDCQPQAGTGPFSSCVRSAVTNDCLAPTNNGMGTSCFPNVAVRSTTLFSAAQSNTMYQASAFCNWACAGGQTCRINLSDGLPVDLLDFEVDQPRRDTAEARSEAEPQQ